MGGTLYGDTTIMQEQPKVFASAATLAAELDISVSAFWRLAKQEGFPDPIRLGPRCTRFDRAAFLDAVRAKGTGPAKAIRRTSKAAAGAAA